MADEFKFIVIIESGRILDGQVFCDAMSAEQYAQARCRARHLHRYDEPCPYVLSEARVTREGYVFQITRKKEAQL
jgi:hypothetical protein